MTGTTGQLEVLTDAPIETWFGVGGRADRYAVVRTFDELRQAIELDPDLRILGDGANLLVDDAGVADLVVTLEAPGFTEQGIDDETGLYVAGAGVRLPQLILETIRQGMGGLEALGGIPASVGGATVMNAGGKYGAIADHVIRVHAIDRAGREHTIDRGRIDFGYRQSHLNHLIVTRVEFDLARESPEALRARLKDVMAYKKRTQPLRDHSAGCVFKNPILSDDVDGIGRAGERVGAGLLIDRAGLKGRAVGGAAISPHHGNFFTTTPDATASDLIELIEQARAGVLDAFGVELEREIVIWGRDP